MQTQHGQSTNQTKYMHTLSTTVAVVLLLPDVYRQRRCDMSHVSTLESHLQAQHPIVFIKRQHDLVLVKTAGVCCGVVRPARQHSTARHSTQKMSKGTCTMHGTGAAGQQTQHNGVNVKQSMHH
jgi:hypothetical protein